MGVRKPSARSRILQLLKERGRLTTQAIADLLDITPVGVRKHLVALQREALVVAERVPLPRGRPTHAFSLTDSASSQFPRAYDQLAVEILGDLAALDGHEKLQRLFQLRNERVRQDYEIRLGGKDLPERVRELTQMRDEDGYMAVFEERDGTFVLREHNCPILAVALRYQEACRCEEDLFKKLLNKDVSRESSLLEGSHCCGYRIDGEPGTNT